MRGDMITIFPEIVRPYLEWGVLKRIQEKGLLEVRVHNLRDYCTDKHQQVDDAPFGGGPGMVLKPEPIFRAVESIASPGARVILTSPQGRLFSQWVAEQLAKEAHLVIICGRYEGVDERVAEYLATDEISIGDYVLSGGELPALVILDAVARRLPGALGNEASAELDSFAGCLLDYPHYTRPAEFRGYTVPEVLRSGNHEEIQRWRKKQALLRTWKRRPELLARVRLSPEDQVLLEELKEKEKEGVVNSRS